MQTLNADKLKILIESASNKLFKEPLFLISSILIQLFLFLLEPSNKETKPIIPGVVSKIESICLIIFDIFWFSIIT